MNTSIPVTPRANTAANLSPLKTQRPAAEPAGDQLAGSAHTPDPALARRPTFPSNPDVTAASKPQAGISLSTGVKLGAIAMAGLSLAGCIPPSAPAVVETQSQKAAHSVFSQAIGQLEEQMTTTQGGDTHVQAETFTNRFLETVGTYTKTVGAGSAVALQGITSELQAHPAMAATVAFALGAAGGITLESFGLTDSIKNGVADIAAWAKEHPLPAIALGVAVAAASSALIYELANVQASIPNKPDTKEGQALNASFQRLEDQVRSGKIDSKTATSSVMEAINHYKETSQRAWTDVASDVKAFAFDHPILATTLVAGAGAATGIVLQRAGVPAQIANLLTPVLHAGENIGSNAIEYAKEHPLIVGVAAAAVAAGVGYMAYEYFQPSAPAPAIIANPM